MTGASAVKRWTPTFLILASFLLLFVPSGWVVIFRNTVLTVVSPVDRLVAGSLEKLAQAPRALLNVPEPPSQIKSLRNELTAAKSELASERERTAELQRVIASLTEAKELVGSAPLAPMAVGIAEKQARVMAAHQGLRATLVISAGRISGIKEGDPVVSAKNVVGRVISAGLDTSQVQLVTDPGFCAAVVTYPGATEGTVHGEAGSHCVMKHVLQTDAIAPEDTVLTSGFGGDFPRGFVVGRVSKVASTYDARFQRVEIEPAITVEQLETVVVLVKKAQDNP